MPFKSKKQEKWMWTNKPELAKEWTKKYGHTTENKWEIIAGRKGKRRKK